MATVGQYNPSIIDVQKTLDPNGKPARIIEILTQDTRVLDDIVWVQCNKKTSHVSTVAASLPDVFWKQIGQGVPASKDTDVQVEEATGIMESWLVVPKEVAEYSGDAAAYRASRMPRRLEALRQEAMQTLFYGSSTAPGEFVGLSSRYSSASAANGKNIIKLGGSGNDNSSIWLVVWGEEFIHAIYPEGKPLGIDHRDYGLQVVPTSTTLGAGQTEAYREVFSWCMGLATPDWRWAVRACNIDISDLKAESNAADLIKAMAKMTHRLPSTEVGRPAFYMNRTVFQQLDIQRFNAVEGSGLTYSEVDGKRIPAFRGIPIRISDALLDTEATVS